MFVFMHAFYEICSEFTVIRATNRWTFINWFFQSILFFGIQVKTFHHIFQCISYNLSIFLLSFFFTFEKKNIFICLIFQSFKWWDIELEELHTAPIPFCTHAVKHFDSCVSGTWWLLSTSTAASLAFVDSIHSSMICFNFCISAYVMNANECKWMNEQLQIIIYHKAPNCTWFSKIYSAFSASICRFSKLDFQLLEIINYLNKKIIPLRWQILLSQTK